MADIIDRRDYKLRLRRDLTEVTVNYITTLERISQTFVDAKLLPEKECIIISNEIIQQLMDISKAQTVETLKEMEGEK